MRRFRESQLSQDGVSSRLNHRKRRSNRNIHLRNHKRKATCRNKTNDKENVSPSSLSPASSASQENSTSRKRRRRGALHSLSAGPRDRRKSSRLQGNDSDLLSLSQVNRRVSERLQGNDSDEPRNRRVSARLQGDDSDLLSLSQVREPRRRRGRVRGPREPVTEQSPTSPRRTRRSRRLFSPSSNLPLDPLDPFATILEKKENDWMTFTEFINVTRPPVQYTRDEEGRTVVVNEKLIYSHDVNAEARKNFRHCPFRTTLAYHLQSGLVRQYEASNEGFLASLASNEERDSFVASYEAAMKPECKLVGCAGCGVVLGIDETILMDVTMLEHLALSPSDVSTYLETSEVYRNARNVVRVGSAFYFASPDLVNASDGRTTGQFCKNCQKSTYQTGTHSSFRDFDPLRINDEMKKTFKSLTLAERVAIARSIAYLATTKISGRVSRLKTHAFTVPLAHAEFVSTSGLNTTAAKTITALCVGSGIGLKTMRELALRTITIDVQKCRCVLEYLRDMMHPEYVGPIDDLDELSTQAAQMSATMKDSIGIASDSLTLAVESRVERTEGECATALLLGERAVENGQILRAAGEKINELSETRLRFLCELENEFIMNHKILGGAFPWLFPGGLPEGLGRGYLRPALARRLLTYYDGRFEASVQFICVAGSQAIRHRTCSSVSGRGGKESRDKFVAMMQEDGFREKLQHASQNPNKPASIALAKRLQTVLRIAGKRVPWSAEERSAELPKILAMFDRYGPPLWFATISPFPPNDPRCMREAHRSFSKTNVTFAQSNDIASRMRLEYAAPATCALAYERKITAIHKTILGVELPTRRSAKRTRSVNTSAPHVSRGVLGPLSAAVLESEDQTRGTLHGHGLPWAAFGAVFLARRVHNPEFQNVYRRHYDKVVSASIPKELHDKREAKTPVDWPPTCPLTADGFSKLGFETASSANFHRHSARCRKGTFGVEHCAMGYRKPITPKSRFLSLTLANEKGKAMKDRTIVTSPDIPEPPSDDFLPGAPFPEPDRRCIVIETRRVDKDDAYVAAFNPLIAAATGANSNLEHLGVGGGGRAAANYVAKYATKNTSGFTEALTVTAAADRAATLYPSKADDAGTIERDATYRIQKALMSMRTNTTEIAMSQLSSALIGMRSSYNTDAFKYVFLRNAFSYFVDVPDETVNNDDVDDDIDSMSDDDDFERSLDTAGRQIDSKCAAIDDAVENDDPLLCVETTEGAADIIRDEDGSIQYVEQWLDYLYRPDDLRFMNVIEFFGTIGKIKRPRTVPKVTGLCTYAFRNGHPQQATHYLRHLEVHRSIIVAGREPPQRSAYRKDPKGFRVYYAALIFPWWKKDSSNMHGPYRNGVFLAGSRAFRAEMNRLRQSTSYVDRSRYYTYLNYIGRNATHKQRLLVRRYKNILSDKWSDLKPADRPPAWTPSKGAGSGITPDAVTTAAALFLASTTRGAKRDRIVVAREQLRSRYESVLLDAFKSRPELFAGDDNAISLPDNLSTWKSGSWSVRQSARLYEEPGGSKENEDEDEDAVPSGTKIDDCNDNNDNEVRRQRSDQLERGIDDGFSWAPDRPLNREQEAFYNAVRNHIRNNTQSLLLLHGLPGSGKTYTIGAVCDMLTRAKLTPYASAYMWTAVFQLKFPCEKSSIHRMIGCTNLSHMSKPTSVLRRPFRAKELTRIRSNLGSVDYIIIDEISAVDCGILVYIDRALRAAFEESIVFGGKSLILLGDFAQIRPPKGLSLAFAAVNTNLVGRQRGAIRAGLPPRDQITVKATDLFCRFRRYMLLQQERARGDAEHTAWLRRFTLSADDTDVPITKEKIASIQRLTKDLVRRDPEWANATYAVLSNFERRIINRQKISQFARINRRPIFRWILPLRFRAPDSSRSVDESYPFERTRQLIERCGAYELECFFVLGMPVVVDEAEGHVGWKICRNRRGIAHSFSYSEYNEPGTLLSEDGRVLDGSELRPGEVVTIQRPDFVIISSKQMDGDGNVLFPMKLKVSSTPMAEFLGRNKEEMSVTLLGEDYQDKSAPSVSRHQFSPGFAYTYNKLQGMTLDRVVMVCHRSRNVRLGTMSIEKFFVGASRVRHGKHLAFLPAEDDNEFNYLEKLKFPAQSRLWDRNYADHEWKEATRFILPDIKKVMEKIRRSGGLGKAPTATIKSALSQLGIPYKGLKGKALLDALRPAYKQYAPSK